MSLGEIGLICGKFCFLCAGNNSIHAGNRLGLFLDAIAQLSRNLFRPWESDSDGIKPVPFGLFDLKAEKISDDACEAFIHRQSPQP